jgi:hypothetical protein
MKTVHVATCEVKCSGWWCHNNFGGAASVGGGEKSEVRGMGENEVKTDKGGLWAGSIPTRIEMYCQVLCLKPVRRALCANVNIGSSGECC